MIEVKFGSSHTSVSVQGAKLVGQCQAVRYLRDATVLGPLSAFVLYIQANERNVYLRYEYRPTEYDVPLT